MVGHRDAITPPVQPTSRRRATRDVTRAASAFRIGTAKSAGELAQVPPGMNKCYDMRNTGEHRLPAISLSNITQEVRTPVKS